MSILWVSRPYLHKIDLRKFGNTINRRDDLLGSIEEQKLRIQKFYLLKEKVPYADHDKSKVYIELKKVRKLVRRPKE
jgi:hypothetical protein